MGHAKSPSSASGWGWKLAGKAIVCSAAYHAETIRQSVMKEAASLGSLLVTKNFALHSDVEAREEACLFL